MKFNYRKKIFDINGYSSKDHISQAISRKRTFYERDLLEYMRLVAGRSDDSSIALDIGANIGNHSIFISNFISGRLIAVEPNELVIPVLKENLDRNGAEFEVIDQAVGDAIGCGSVVLPADDQDNMGMAEVTAGSPDDSPVSITTIDKIIEDYRYRNGISFRVSVIKIDIEGGEAAALRGARHTLVNHCPDLFLEARDKAAVAELAKILLPLGYVRLSQWATTPVFHFAMQPSTFRRLQLKMYAAYVRYWVMTRGR